MKSTSTVNNHEPLHFREATVKDINAMHRVRMSVKENVLSNPQLVKEEDYLRYIHHPGRGWVAESTDTIIGFAIIDLRERNVWALFVDPNYEGRGIGKTLHDCMLTWYFQNTVDPVKLSTGSGTRAEYFYRISGWEEKGRKENGEIVFELSYEKFHRHKTTDG
jgi:GNAT superfamily N-acetyltransferase